MKKCVSLIRVSTDLQTEKNGGTSLQIQRDKLSKYAELNDLELTNKYFFETLNFSDNAGEAPVCSA